MRSIEVEVAKRRRKCHQCGESIPKGWSHLAVGSSSRGKTNICEVCLECTLEMVTEDNDFRREQENDRAQSI
jgi:hypothetical protein